MTRPRLRLLVVAALGFVPWTVVVYPGGLDLILPWGLLGTDPLSLVDIYTYLFVYTGGPSTLPDRLLAWPIATVSYALSVCSVLLGFVGFEDSRVTAGLLFVSGVAHLQVTLGLGRIGLEAYPLGAVLAFLVAWWTYETGPSN